MSDDEFNDLNVDDPEFFWDDVHNPSKNSEYFAAQSPLPALYEPEHEFRNTEADGDLPYAELADIQGAPGLPQVELEPHETPEPVNFEPPAGKLDHFVPNEDMGDPEAPEDHTIEPPERAQAEDHYSAAMYGPMDDPEVPERPSWESRQADHRDEVEKVTSKPPDEPFDFPRFQEAPYEPMPAVEYQHRESDVLFPEPARGSQMATYSPPWM